MSDTFWLAAIIERTSRFHRGEGRCAMTRQRDLRLLTALSFSLSLGPQIGHTQEAHTVATERHLVVEAQSNTAAARHETSRVADKGPRIRGIFVPSAGVVGMFSRAAYFQRAPVCDIFETILSQKTASVASRMERQNGAECTIEVTPRQSPPSLSEFLFVQVRTEADRVSSLRFKLVTAQKSAPEGTPGHLAEIASNFFRAMHWNDLAELSPRIKALEPFDVTRYGINLRMIKEETLSGAYDLFVTPQLTSADQAQTSNFEKSED